MNLRLRSFETGNLSADNFKKYSTSMGEHLSPRYGQVILVSGCPLLTAVNWSQHWCAVWRSYGHVITKFSRMGRLPHFLTYGAPPTLARFARGWSSAINLLMGASLLALAKSIYYSITETFKIRKHLQRFKCEFFFFFFYLKNAVWCKSSV